MSNELVLIKGKPAIILIKEKQVVAFSVGGASIYNTFNLVEFENGDKAEVMNEDITYLEYQDGKLVV